MEYILNVEKKRQYIMAFLLDLMFQRDFKVKLDGNDAYLDSIFVEMLALKYIKVQGDIYVVDEKGLDFSENYTQKYNEFLKFYDIFCAVDLESGDFAFKHYYEFDNDEDWFNYLEQPNWSDVRIAVCNFKKIDPIEIVFLSFVKEGKFNDVNQLDWQMSLLSYKTWKEILDVCNTAITLDEDVVKDIIEQGSIIAMDMIKEEANRNAETEAENDQEEIIEEVIVEETVYVDDVVYYDPYLYDPYYVSPCWLLLW